MIEDFFELSPRHYLQEVNLFQLETNEKVFQNSFVI